MIICSEVRWRAMTLDGAGERHCRGEEKRRCLAALIARDAPRVYAYGEAVPIWLTCSWCSSLLDQPVRSPCARLPPHVQVCTGTSGDRQSGNRA